MPTASTSCSRCNQPLAVESAGGLCAPCVLAIETSRPVATPQDCSRTRTQIESGTAPPTRTAEVEGATIDIAKGGVKLRPPPAGYDLFRYLGGGGMGDVYLAREHAAERTVAIKFLRATSNPASIERFLTEVRALARLDHPNIVRIISVDLERVDPHFTMEYAGAGTLTDRVKSEGPYAPAEAARIGACLARAMHAAHVAEIIHRDLKPSNVLIAADGTPKISDFGLAKRMDFDEGLTYTSQLLGTPSFMPPEQISRENGDITARSDVYGLGATLFYMLTGKAPFEDAKPESVLKMVRFDPPSRPRALRPDVPIELEAVVLKCLEKKSADRYASAEELAADLDRVLAGQAPAAPQLTPLRRAKKWFVRNRVAIASVAVVAVAAILIAAMARPVYPLEDLQRKLIGGKSVALVGERGHPRMFDWKLTPSALGESSAGDGTASFQTEEYTLLELVRDPGVDRYRITADLRHMTAPLPPKDGSVTMGFVGLYCGHEVQHGDEGKKANGLFTLQFADMAALPVKGAPKEIRALVRLGILVQKPDSTNSPNWAGLGSLPYKPNDLAWPGLWRRVRFDVTPDGVTVEFQETEAVGFAPVHRMTKESIDAKYAELTAIAVKNKQVVALAPEWKPRAPMGIIAYRSAVAFKNVTIEPLP